MSFEVLCINRKFDIRTKFISLKIRLNEIGRLSYLIQLLASCLRYFVFF